MPCHVDSSTNNLVCAFVFTLFASPGGRHRRASLDIPKLCIHCVHLEAKQEKMLRQAILASTSSLANSIYPDIEISPPPVDDSDYCSTSQFVVSEEEGEDDDDEDDDEDDEDDDESEYSG